MFLKNRNIIFKMKISKVTDYAALIFCLQSLSKTLLELTRIDESLVYLSYPQEETNKPGSGVVLDCIDS